MPPLLPSSPQRLLPTVCDVDGRLHLVAREDPDLDARPLQRLDALRHPLLQLVLDGRAAEQNEVALNQLSDLAGEGDGGWGFRGERGTRVEMREGGRGNGQSKGDNSNSNR